MRPAREHGFGVTVLEPVRGEDAMVYSSTHIRELLKAGKPREAAALLGRYWEIDGRVATGDRRGRTIGFPTANLGLDDYLHPAFGVYAVRVSGDGPDDPLAGRTVDGVANIGLRPTVGGLVPRLEAHLFDIDVDLYGRHLRVALVDFIRPGAEIRRSRRAEGADRRGCRPGARHPRRGYASLTGCEPHPYFPASFRKSAVPMPTDYRPTVFLPKNRFPDAGRFAEARAGDPRALGGYGPLSPAARSVARARKIHPA